MAVKEKRRQLGMMYRAFVRRAFSMDQYLTRHAQQLFLGRGEKKREERKEKSGIGTRREAEGSRGKKRTISLLIEYNRKKAIEREKLTVPCLASMRSSERVVQAAHRTSQTSLTDRLGKSTRHMLLAERNILESTGKRKEEEQHKRSEKRAGREDREHREQVAEREAQEEQKSRREERKE